jgi:hypothetical protein
MAKGYTIEVDILIWPTKGPGTEAAALRVTVPVFSWTWGIYGCNEVFVMKTPRRYRRTATAEAKVRMLAD